MGGCSLSKLDNIIIPGLYYAIVENEFVRLVDLVSFENIKLNNEWDVKELCNVFKDVGE